MERTTYTSWFIISSILPILLETFFYLRIFPVCQKNWGRYYIIKVNWGAKVTLTCIYLLTRNLLYVMRHWINWSDLNITVGEKKKTVFTVLIWTAGLCFSTLKSGKNTIIKGFLFVCVCFLKFCFEHGDNYTDGYNLSSNLELYI